MPGFIDLPESSQGDSMRIRFRRIAFVVLLSTLPLFGAYLWLLYGQLARTFEQVVQFIPNRIYSDVSRVAAGQNRGLIESRLKNLGYKVQNRGAELAFILHPVDYPLFLLPEGHVTSKGGQQSIVLSFDGAGAEARLSTVSANGKEISELFLEPELVATLSRGTGSEVRAPVKFKEIPPLVYQSIIAIEDQHFMEHNGLDPRGIARALWVDIRTRSFAQGGSTITQQLVKNLMARRNKNIFRKLNELFLAIFLEARFDKKQILERYLNEVYLGQVGSLEIHGVAEGAEHFFGKSLKELNLAEIALMAGLIRGPGYYSPYRYYERAMERQRLVLRKMAETGQIAEGESKAALTLPVRLAPPQAAANKAPYFSDFVKAELIRQFKDRMTEDEISLAGYRIYTTLDARMSTVAQEAVAQGIAQLEKNLKIQAPDRLEGALAAVDHTTGYIRALIGGRNYSQSTFNRILNMKRQVGSTFKPIVYLTALSKGMDANGVAYGPGHPAEDAPWTLKYDRGKQTWNPKNYEKEFMQWITYRTALAHSVNTVAARLGYEVGLKSIIETARALGVESELPAVPSLSLGVAELSPIELLRVYATFANHGIQDDLTVIRAITQEDGKLVARFVYHPKQVYEPGPIDLLTDMLQSVFTEGTARSAHGLGFDRPAAGKTGTTSHHRDSWFAGYTPQLTTVVWVGMDQSTLESKANNKDDSKKKHAPIATLTGATSALPIWTSFMNKALMSEDSAPFSISPHLIEVQIDRHSGQQALGDCPPAQVITEKYIRGKEPRDRSCEILWPPSTPETEGN